MMIDEYGFHVPAWPMACPPIHSQADILSVTVGNTHLTWTLHGTFEQEFVPEVFWRTEALSDKDDDSIEDDDDDVQSPPSRSRTLNDFLAESVREKLFGSADFTTLSAAQFRFTQKRIPYIYIYVISTNPEHASSLVALFRGVPCILYRLTGNDFIQLPPLVDGELSKSPPITIYNGIGVDRVANIIGTKALFPKAKHLLVIDGGTALTFTTMVRVPYTDTTNNNSISYRLQMGGGICPGMQMRFRSLFEYTANLPLAETSYVKNLMRECEEMKKPLPLFTSSSTSSSTQDEMHVGEDEKLVSKSIIGGVMTEVALILCNTIQQWLTIPHNNDASNGNQASSQESTPHGDLLTMPVVILTGGDCEIFKKLLKPYHSYICDTNDANIELLNQALVDDETLSTLQHLSRKETSTVAGGQKFLIRCEKRLQNYAVSHVLSSHCTASVAPITTQNGSDKDIDVELLRNQFPGLRIARQNTKNKSVVLGTVVSLKRGIQLDDDQCIVIYDGDKKMYSLKIHEVYDAFQLFLDTPEKSRTKDENARIGMACRRKDVEEAIAALRKTSPTIRKIVEAQKPAPEQRDAPELTVDNFDATMASLKRKNMANAPKTNKRFAAMNPESYEKERIAKYFEIDENKMALFFGTVTKYVHEEKWWHVEYDDGDNEDMSVNELMTHLELYEANKSSDTNNKQL